MSRDANLWKLLPIDSQSGGQVELVVHHSDFESLAVAG
jgi:hypothetical protein